MGAIVLGELEEPGSFAAQEPVAELDVSHGPLEGTEVGPRRCRWPSTSYRWSRCWVALPKARRWCAGRGELRLKESDRIATVVDGLRGLGADIEAAPDGFVVRGTGGLRGGSIDAHGDHRLALLGAVAGLASQEGVEVMGMDAAGGLLSGLRRRYRGAPGTGTLMRGGHRRAGRGGKIDGGQRVARELGFTYLDSGAMYRAWRWPRASAGGAGRGGGTSCGSSSATGSGSTAGT